MRLPFYTSRPAIGYGTYIHDRERQIHFSVHCAYPARRHNGPQTSLKQQVADPLLDGSKLMAWGCILSIPVTRITIPKEMLQTQI